MSDRDDLIAALLAPENVRVEMVTVTLGGVERKIGVKQMSMGVHGKLSARLYKAHKAEDLAEIAAVKVEVVKECACDSEGKRLFVNAADAARVSNQAGIGWIDQVFETAMRLMTAPNQKTCALEVEPAVAAKPAHGDQPAVAAKAAKVCGGLLTLGAKFCPHCGGEVPNAQEVALGN